MNKFLLLLCVCLGLLLSEVAQTAESGDVYNFYFQKASPAKETDKTKQVNQTVDAPKESPEQQVEKPAEKLSTTKTTEVAEQETSNRYHRWAIAAGIGNQGSIGVASLSISGEYHYNKYFGANAELLLPTGSSGYYKDERANMQMALGVIVTPFNIQLFGLNFIDISAVAGGMTVQGYDYDYQFFPTDKGTRFVAYLGPRIALKFGDHLSFFISGRLSVNTQYDTSQSTMALAWKF